MKFLTIPVIVATLALAGCAGNQKITVGGSTLIVPKSLQSCAPKPTKPIGEYTQKDVARYIAKLSAAHSDCADDLKALNKLVVAAQPKKKK